MYYFLKILISAIYFILLFLTYSCSGGRRLVWSDEFNYRGFPDSTKWIYENGYVRNKELQYYTKSRPENARVENGNLVIEARKEKLLNKDYKPESKNWREQDEYVSYTSASLKTFKKADWKYGRIEIKAKLPQGKGIWPAIWTLGANSAEAGWPGCGEIDIMEFIGRDPKTIYGTVHYSLEGKHKQSSANIKIENLFDDFHTYTIEWYPDSIDFYFDETKYHTFIYEKAGLTGDDNPFCKQHYLLLNLALGGSWSGELDESVLPQKYIIDYVRVYELEVK
jgi:beta-glucanase (GH16 family)